MGISGLLPLLKSIHKQCNLKQFAGQTIGVDAYGWLHRGTVACAVDLALGKPTTKYVDFAMSRVRMLVHFGITPYIIFDGDYLPSKAGTEKDRAARRKESRRQGLELLRLGKTTQAHQELQKAVDVTPEMARMLIEELKKSKIQYVVAPYEADSQLAYLERKGIIQGILSEDSDLLVFGARCLITKLDQYGDCVLIRRDDFTGCREISLVGWSDADFRRMAILSGCDYLASMNKMGLKTAYRLLRKHKTIDRLLRCLKFEGQFKVPPGYAEAFQQAEMTFLYQWVFCPNGKNLVNLTEPKEGVDVSGMPYIGKYVEATIAAGVACGDLNPHTKEPIVIDTSHTRSHNFTKPAIPRKQAINETPELKKVKSIDSFFKPRRTPLAELDPNSFTPSPSQQRLLNQARNSWSASPAPARIYRTTPSTPSTPSAPPTAPQLSRRTVSETWYETPTISRSPKRQRLCSDSTSVLPQDTPVKVETGTSRFFSASTKASPSTPARRISQSEFNVWSDDSIDDALAQIPDPENDETVDESGDNSLALEESTQSTTNANSQCTTDQSQCVTGMSTPATSCDSFRSEIEGEKSIFGEHLDAELKGLREKFAYNKSKPIFIPAGSSQTTSKHRSSLPPSFERSVRNPLLHNKKPPSLPRAISSPIGHNQHVPSSSTLRRTSSNLQSHASSNSPSITTPAKRRATSPPKSTDRSIYSARNQKAKLDNAPARKGSACTTTEADVEVLASEDDSCGGIDARKPYDYKIKASSFKGSEDYIVPDSESDAEVESIGDPSPVKLDLGRFAFKAK